MGVIFEATVKALPLFLRGVTYEGELCIPSSCTLERKAGPRTDAENVAVSSVLKDVGTAVHLGHFSSKGTEPFSSSKTQSDYLSSASLLGYVRSHNQEAPPIKVLCVISF